MTRLAITGINGFVGKHLANELHQRGCEVVGIGREPEVNPKINSITDEYYACDLTSTEDVAKLQLEGIDGIINLAGFAAVGASYDQEELYMRVNVGVLTVISERILELGLKIRMLAISTGAVYSPDQSLPLREDSKLITAGSPYALSKIAMEAEAVRLRGLGLECVVARPFNHIGPGQEPGFLVPDLYKKITAALVTGEPVKVGNLSTKRDYTDVRDVARAYADLALSENLNHEIYNICSGRSISGSTIYDLLISNIENSGRVKTEVDPILIRPNDPKDIYGDHSHISEDCGWQPEIKLEQTIKDFTASH